MPSGNVGVVPLLLVMPTDIADGDVDHFDRRVQATAALRAGSIARETSVFVMLADSVPASALDHSFHV